MSEFIKTKGAKASYFAAGIAAIVAVMFLVFTNSDISASMKAAKMVFTEDAHDFGVVSQGPQLEYNFKFTNKGNAPLIIEKVQTSCGCTGATMGDKKEFAKGESGEIHVTFNTQGREGAQEKTLLVYSNDPANPQKVLKFTCTIDPSKQ